VTTQPAGEHHTGTLNLAGEGNPQEATRRCWCGGDVAQRSPGDSDGLGCAANIMHNWRGDSHDCRNCEDSDPGAMHTQDQFCAVGKCLPGCTLTAPHRSPCGPEHARDEASLVKVSSRVWARPDIDLDFDDVHAIVEAATPAIRQQVAEEIATKANQIAEQYQRTAVEHRNLAGPKTTDKQMLHHRTAIAHRNKADGAWAVAHAAREIGGAA